MGNVDFTECFAEKLCDFYIVKITLLDLPSIWRNLSHNRKHYYYKRCNYTKWGKVLLHVHSHNTGQLQLFHKCVILIAVNQRGLGFRSSYSAPNLKGLVYDRNRSFGRSFGQFRPNQFGRSFGGGCRIGRIGKNPRFWPFFDYFFINFLIFSQCTNY